MSTPAKARTNVKLHKESGGNPIHRRLKFHEKKLLKKHDFMQYPQDLWHEPYAIKKFHLTDREDYRRYLRLVGLVRACAPPAPLRPLQSTSWDSCACAGQARRLLDHLGALWGIPVTLGYL